MALVYIGGVHDRVTVRFTFVSHLETARITAARRHNRDLMTPINNYNSLIVMTASSQITSDHITDVPGNSIEGITITQSISVVSC